MNSLANIAADYLIPPDTLCTDADSCNSYDGSIDTDACDLSIAEGEDDVQLQLLIQP
jgi:hypothetical protein